MEKNFLYNLKEYNNNYQLFNEKKIEIELDGYGISIVLKQAQEKLNIFLTEISNQKINQNQLIEFISYFNDIFKIIEIINEINEFSEVVIFKLDQSYNEEHNRLKISIKDIFDTEIDIALYGEAGAGKTTSLQVYAKEKIKTERNKIILFIPLARIIFNIDKEVKENEYCKILEYNIYSYFHELDNNITEQDFFYTLSCKKIVFLLDGIDEAIAITPWIISAIIKLKEKYNNSQFIISSRMSGEYIKEIPFLGFTLLPFTDNQIKKFITNWFKEKAKDKIKIIVKHLKENELMKDFIKNPLHATILCILCDFGVPLPKTKIRLYEERIRLLLGEYDIYKKVRNRVITEHTLRRKIAQRLAYLFHIKKERYDTYLALKEYCINYFNSFYDSEIINIAVDELIEPCNILISHSLTNKYGFGHLGFQEYLVACELSNDRGISISKFLGDPWWENVLQIFSQMTTDISFVINELNVEGTNLSYKINTIKK